jgi:hypothetical protein
MKISKIIILPSTLAVATLIGVTGGSLLNGLTAGATNTTATTKSTSDQTTKTNPPVQTDPSKGGHTVNNKTESVLAGDAAEKVKAAALAAVSGGTIQRVENDVDGGGTFEAHMTDANGKQVTVYLDASYKVISTKDGMGITLDRDGKQMATPSSKTQ